ncbi:hypothetical protein PBAC_13560 [Pedobacter glucosidilyticus]|nr:hypothetical protein PBAC_13560 [Pedobacter glucosidilyticus]
MRYRYYFYSFITFTTGILLYFKNEENFLISLLLFPIAFNFLYIECEKLIASERLRKILKLLTYLIPLCLIAYLLIY